MKESRAFYSVCVRERESERRGRLEEIKSKEMKEKYITSPAAICGLITKSRPSEQIRGCS